MFASVDLAARIDTAEARFSRAIAMALSSTQAFAISVGSGSAVFGKPGSPINKVIGIGIEEPVSAEQIEVVEKAYRDREEDVRVELSTLAKVEVGELLTARGYRLRGFENVLGLDLQRHAAGSAIGIDVERVTEMSPWLDVLVDGFVAPDDTGVPGEVFPRAIIEDVVSDLARLPEVGRYMARVNGEPAGSASMRVDRGIAVMSGAATRPAFRKRGVQQALLQRRIEAAREAGCDIAVVTTSPGSRSQANADRHGFRLLYSRAVLVLA